MSRIAVVEDNPQLRELVVRQLRPKGYEIEAFPDGAAALQAILKGGFHMVVTDVEMPMMDGISLTKALRQRWSKNALPVVVLSALDAEDDILRGYDAGANDYLVKPYNAPLLQAKVSLLLRVREDTTASMPAAPLAPDEEPGQFPFDFDKYSVSEELGRGGMSVVYRAKRRSDGKVVALKMFAHWVTADRRGLARYFREIAALANVHSRHVVGVVDSGFERGRYFLAMEFVDGQPMKGLLKERGRLDEKDAFRIGADVCLGMLALEDAALVHRDVKPANVMVVPDGRAILVDLGLAKSQTDDDVTGSDAVLGTPQYLAPELLRGANASPMSDVFSLGATLYEALSGQKPYAGSGTREVVQLKLAGKDPPPLQKIAPGVTDEAAALIARMMARAPDARPDDLRELEEDLRALAAAR